MAERFYDVCEKEFASRKDADDNLESALKVIKATQDAVLNSKLNKDGLEIVGEVHCCYVAIKEIIDGDQTWKKGSFLIERRITAWLEKKSGTL